MRPNRTSLVMIGRPCLLVALSIALPIAIAFAQTGTYLPGAKTGAAVGSLEVFVAFMADHDAGYYAEDAEFHVMAMPEPYVGREAIAGALGVFYGGAFTDTHVDYLSLVADGHRVVLEFVYHGTNTGDFMHWPATGARVRVPMMGIYEVHDGLIMRGRLYFDFATLLIQLGHD